MEALQQQLVAGRVIAEDGCPLPEHEHFRWVLGPWLRLFRDVCDKVREQPSLNCRQRGQNFGLPSLSNDLFYNFLAKGSLGGEIASRTQGLIGQRERGPLLR